MVIWKQKIVPKRSWVPPGQRHTVRNTDVTIGGGGKAALAGDNVPPEDKTESPYDAGHREFREMLDAGRPGRLRSPIHPHGTGSGGWE